MQLKLLTILFAIFSVYFSCLGESNVNTDKSIVVKYFSGGKESHLQEADEQTALIKLVVDRFTLCDDLLELSVTDEAIDDLKGSEDCIEIIFPDERKFDISGKQEVTASRIFIPLSGKYAKDDRLTFFYGTTKWYSGPFVRNEGQKDLKSEIEKFFEK